MKFLLFSTLFVVAALPIQAAIVWTGAASTDIFDEANWDLTGSGVAVVDPNVTINDDVIFANANVVIPNVGGQVRFQVGDGFIVTVDNSTIAAIGGGNDGFGGVPATTNGPTVNLVNGAAFNPFFIVNDVSLNIGAGTSATFGGGGNPINISTVDIEPSGVLGFVLENPTEFTNEHLGKTSVLGQPAVDGVNITIAGGDPFGGGQGSTITAIPEPSSSVLFGLAGLGLILRRRT